MQTSEDTQMACISSGHCKYHWVDSRLLSVDSLWISLVFEYSGLHFAWHRPYHRGTGISLKHNSLSYGKHNSIRNTENLNASEICCILWWRMRLVNCMWHDRQIKQPLHHESQITELKLFIIGILSKQRTITCTFICAPLDVFPFSVIQNGIYVESKTKYMYKLAS